MQAFTDASVAIDSLGYEVLDQPFFQAADASRPDLVALDVYARLSAAPGVAKDLLANGTMTELRVGDAEILLLQPSIDASDLLPLSDHEAEEITPDKLDSLRTALDHLRMIFPAGFAHVTKVVRTITWVRSSAPSSPGSVPITSASLPAAPLWVFISDLAAVHLPPRSLADRPSARYFAENLYHESIHQLITLHLLSGNLFGDDYSSSTSPRVEIPWRDDADARNSAWELDRVLHAASVYDALKVFRFFELADPSLSEEERHFFGLANEDAAPALDFLTSRLLEHTELLTPGGAQYVQLLRTRV